MNGLFMPKEPEKKIDDLVNREKPVKNTGFSGDDVLVFANDGIVYALPSFDEKPIKLGERSSYISDVCVHDGIIYDSAYDHIYNSLTGGSVAFRPGVVSTIESFKGAMYDSGFHKIVYNTLTDETFSECFNTVFGLTVHKDELYGLVQNMLIKVEEDSCVYETINEFPGQFLDACSDGDDLYICGRSAEEGGSYIFEQGANAEIARRRSTDVCLVYHNGLVLDADFSGKVRDTINGKLVYNFEDNIACMVSVPKEVLEGFI